MSKYSYQLVVQRGPRPGEIFSLNQTTIILGRDPMTDIVVNDPEISRNHARLTHTADGYEIQDMGSTNGTYVNGKRLRGEPILLKPEVEVILGSNVTLSYEVHAVESELLETVLSNTGQYPEEDTPADGAGTLLAADGDGFLDEPHALSVEEFEAEAFPPPTLDQKPADFERAVAAPSAAAAPPPAAVPSPRRAAPPPTPVPIGVNDGSADSKRRNYILIGAGVGVLVCCLLSTVVVLLGYIARIQGLV